MQGARGCTAIGDGLLATSLSRQARAAFPPVGALTIPVGSLMEPTFLVKTKCLRECENIFLSSQELTGHIEFSQNLGEPEMGRTELGAFLALGHWLIWANLALVTLGVRARRQSLAPPQDGPRGKPLPKGSWDPEEQHSEGEGGLNPQRRGRQGRLQGRKSLRSSESGARATPGVQEPSAKTRFEESHTGGAPGHLANQSSRLHPRPPRSLPNNL